MRALTWLVVAAIGMGVMVTAYLTRAQVNPDAPWGAGMIVIGPELPAELGKTGRAIPARVRLLPAIPRAEAMLKALNRRRPRKGRGSSLNYVPS